MGPCRAPLTGSDHRRPGASGLSVTHPSLSLSHSPRPAPRLPPPPQGPSCPSFMLPVGSINLPCSKSRPAQIPGEGRRGGGGVIQSRKGYMYQLRSPAFPGGCPVIISSQRGSVIILIVYIVAQIIIYFF